MFYVKGFHLRRVTVWNRCTLQHQVQQEVILEALEPAAVSNYQPCVVTVSLSQEYQQILSVFADIPLIPKSKTVN